jgi:SulP family sulfate permease
VLQRGRYLNDIGCENVIAPKDDAIATIYPRLDSEVCRTCRARIFAQCHVALPNGEPRTN